MQNDLIVRNEIIHGLRAALELQELVQPDVTTPEETSRKPTTKRKRRGASYH
jgi:hypothetical protein